MFNHTRSKSGRMRNRILAPAFASAAVVAAISTLAACGPTADAHSASHKPAAAQLGSQVNSARHHAHLAHHHAGAPNPGTGASPASAQPGPQAAAKHTPAKTDPKQAAPHKPKSKSKAVRHAGGLLWTLARQRGCGAIDRDRQAAAGEPRSQRNWPASPTVAALVLPGCLGCVLEMVQR
jgi:hypothetical protein